MSFPSFSYESWTPPPPLNQLFVFDGWNSPTAAVLGFGLAAAAVSTAGAMRSGGKDSYAHQGQQQGYPPQGGQQGGYPGQRGQQQGYPPPQGQQGQGQGQQGQGSYQRGQGQQGGYAPQGGSLGSAANPVIPDGARWAPSAPMGTPGNPVIGTAIGTPAVNRGNPAAARREAAASVDELLDLMEDYREDPQQGFRQDYPPRGSSPPDYLPPPSAPALVEAAKSKWRASQDEASSLAGGRDYPRYTGRRGREEPSFRAQPQPPPPDGRPSVGAAGEGRASRRRGEDVYGGDVYGQAAPRRDYLPTGGDVYGEGVYGQALARDPPPSARAVVEAAKATWHAQQDGTWRPPGDPSEAFRDPAALRGAGPSSRRPPQPSAPPPQPQPLVTPEPLAPRGATWATPGGRGGGGGREDGSRPAPPSLQAEAVKAARWLAMQVAPSPRQARARDERRETPNRRRRRQQRVADGAADGR